MTEQGFEFNRSVTSALLSLVIAASLSVACRQPATGPVQRYPVKGKVVNVDKRGSAVTVAHEAIPGYMDAMTMPFKLKDPSLLDVMADGDRLQAMLVVSGTSSWLEEVVVIREEADAKMNSAMSREPRPGDEIPDFALVNQNGNRITVRQYRGRALVVTFIYTRCPLPDYCPLMTARFGDLEKALASEPALYAKTHLLSITVDPEYDTPRVLRQYGAKEMTGGQDNVPPPFAHWELATGSKEQVKAVATYFGMQYWPEGDQIIHSLRTAVIGPDGKLVKLYPGNEWKPEDILAELHNIAGSTQPAQATNEPLPPNVYRGVGVVEEIRKETSTVHINHEEITDFMAAMSMPLKVRDASMLDSISVGDQVEFQVTGALVIIAIKKR
jgi:protein SCO1/2